jgi:hypothetical protein
VEEVPQVLAEVRVVGRLQRLLDDLRRVFRLGGDVLDSAERALDGSDNGLAGELVDGVADLLRHVAIDDAVRAVLAAAGGSGGAPGLARRDRPAGGRLVAGRGHRGGSGATGVTDELGRPAGHVTQVRRGRVGDRGDGRSDRLVEGSGGRGGGGNDPHGGSAADDEQRTRCPANKARCALPLGHRVVRHSIS